MKIKHRTPVKQAVLWSLQLFLIAIVLLISNIAFAIDFTAKTIGDHGNVTVMEVTGNYDANNPDGTINSDPRQAISKEFFRTHQDEYDFLVVFSNFDIKMPDTESKAFYLHVKNDTQGIGQQIYDYSLLFGSNGKLQGTIDMGNISKLITDPTDPNFETTLGILGHEMMHRWAAYVNFKDASGNISAALLSGDRNHWSFLLDTKASLLYGNQWKENGDGTFMSIGIEKYYSPLDLYLMGMYEKSQVSPMLLINNPNIDPSRSPEMGSVVSGTSLSITIDDIIAAEGDRVPGSADSQKAFKTAFIFITSPGTFTGDELNGLENIRSGWLTKYSVLTDGAGLLQVALSPIENVPANPGVIPPTVTPRALPGNLDDGVKWLMTNQKADGSWMDLSQTTERDTAESLLALKNFDIAQQNLTLGLQWLGAASYETTDYLSRKITAMVNAGQDVTALINQLLSIQNVDGGWGITGGFASNPTDTPLVLKSLAKAGYADQTVISKAIEYLKSSQNSDNGWGNDEGSRVEATANVLAAFNKYTGSYQLDDRIATATAWLLRRQNPDGGFGNSTSTVYDTAVAVLALVELDVSQDARSKSLSYILSTQSGDGNWQGSPYQTALAVEALYKATVDPDLAIKNNDITFTPSAITSLPTTVVISANISNLGRTDVPQAKVVLYDGAIADANKVGEQTAAFPGQATVTLTFSVTITGGNEHKFYVSIDPDNLVKESTRANNAAMNILKPQAAYDFEVLPADISASPNPADMLQDVAITSKVTNKGTMNAYNVQLKYYIDDPGNPFDIATATVDIPAGTTITNQITWRANKAGANLPLMVDVDPFNTFAETSKDNNKASISLTVNSSSDPNLTASYKDMVITPNPANQQGSANISVLVRNEGFFAASNIKVNFYEGIPGVDGVLLGNQTIASLNAGDSANVSLDWTNIRDSGSRIIYIRVDPDSRIKEIKKDDNSAFATLKILSLPDLAISTSSIVFSPPAPKEGDTVSIQVTVKNMGEQTVSNINVRAYEGSSVIGTQTVPSISGNSQAIATFTFDTTGKNGAHQITVIVDPDNTIIEQSKDNNQASRSFGVQNSNLWLTEQYISPDGDGIKDSTQFFFSLGSPQSVRIPVVNNKGETVRTFAGSDLQNTTAGNITWDGLNDNGTVVDDGQYQMEVVDANNAVLGSLLVTVDNNRSPLTDAIGTKYLLNTNLTCPLPDIYNWQWLPDESGILFSIFSSNTPSYPAGLYMLPPDGVDISRLIPPDWSQENGYVIKYYDLSPDGTKIVLAVDKYNDPSGDGTSQLWVMDSDGNNMVAVDSYALTWQNSYSSIKNVKWSSNGGYIAYLADNPVGLWVIKPDGTGKIKIEPAGGNIDFSHVRWSPDGNRIAYSIDTYDASFTLRNAMKVSDVSGNRRDISTFTRELYLDWLDDQKIVAVDDTGLWLVDANGGGNIAKISADVFSNILIAPDRKSFAFLRISITADELSLNITGASGDTSVYELGAQDPTTTYQSSGNVVWSPDSTKVSLIYSKQIPMPEGGCKCGGGAAVAAAASDAPGMRHSEVMIARCTFPSFVVIDTKTGQKQSFDINHFADQDCNIAYGFSLVKWLSDGGSIVGNASNNGNNSIFAINSDSGKTAIVASNAIPPRDVAGNVLASLVSPLEHYIMYYQNVDGSSVCYGTSSQDLWSIRSLLNLTADLQITKDKSAVTLRGIAADLNFEGYALEYADANNPDAWSLVAPPSNISVVNDVFTIWVPPYEGVFYVRLIVSDKAGNTATSMKKVSWGLSSSITNLYKSIDIFSPNGDGVKDTVDFNYTVLEPVHLEFNIYDESNTLVRTIPKDYTAYAVDHITWDGKDESGKTVPDGKYEIKVFDYEFFVWVDNTFPDINLTLSGITQNQETLVLSVELSGHAVDKNLKSWTVEYGEGDNPQQWHPLIKGSDLLVKKDENGQPILSPIQDDIIMTYLNDSIEFLVGKKLRLTAEDFAGNKSTMITDFLEEKTILFLHGWYENPPEEKTELISLSETNTTYSNLSLPVLHHLIGIDTFRTPGVSMEIQYGANGQWFDTSPVASSPSDGIDLEWNRSGIGSPDADAVRIKIVDIMGQERFSNAVLIHDLLVLDPCNKLAENLLFEKLKLLKFQVQSDQDARYLQWTDYTVYDAGKGDTIPVGRFLLPLPPVQPGLKFQIGMTGVGVSGNLYTTHAQSPVKCGGGDPTLVSCPINSLS